MAEMKKQSLAGRWNDLQPSKTMLVWSCAGSVVVALIVGFTWGGWVTGGTARDMASAAGDDSRYELASVICVESFLAEPDVAAKLGTFQEIGSSYAQRQFIEEGGWAVMPNAERASRQASDLCAKVLANLDISELTPAESAQAESAVIAE